MTDLLGLLAFLAACGTLWLWMRDPVEPVDHEPVPVAIRNEQTKSTAAFLNGIATAIFAVGALSQTVTAFSDPSSVTLSGIVLVLVCFLGATALHFIARWVLGRLEP